MEQKSIVDFFDMSDIEKMTKWAYKVLQIYVDDRPVFIFGEMVDTHSDILRSYLTTKGIPFEEESLHDESSGPARKGSRYELVGAGSAMVSQKSEDKYKKIIIEDKSIGYSLGPSLDHKLQSDKEDVAISVQTEASKKLLAYKIDFLHSCWAYSFEDSDKIVETFKEPEFGLEKTRLDALVVLYDDFKHTAKVETEFSDVTIQKLTTIRDLILDYV